jgi:2-dehydro-3-deoxy-D-gluconate 5-dehydrogenase
MVLDEFTLTDRVALVTGAGRGLGRALALGLAEAGCHIASVYRTSCDETRRQVEALGRRFLPIRGDLALDPAPPFIEQTVEGLGGLDILVNNAGIIRRTPALDFSERDWDEVIDLNLKSGFFLSQAAARHWTAAGRGGKIIFIASILAFQGGILIPSYTASKHGVAGLVKLLSNEWASKGIHVNAIAPGYMITDNTEAIRNDPARNQAILGRIPAGRWGDPGDLKGAIVFLASRASGYVHGETLVVDGGWLGR